MDANGCALEVSIVNLLANSQTGVKASLHEEIYKELSVGPEVIFLFSIVELQEQNFNYNSSYFVTFFYKLFKIVIRHFS